MPDFKNRTAAHRYSQWFEWPTRQKILERIERHLPE